MCQAMKESGHVRGIEFGSVYTFFCSDFGNVWTVLCFCFALFCLFVCLFVFVFVCLFAVDHKNQTHITRNYK